MKNFQFHIEPVDQEDVLSILRKSNDVLIDTVTDDTIGITIELEDAEADVLYTELKLEIDSFVYSAKRSVL